jgi:UDP-2,3-diacylglucosamine pyrophosphatase LpxH
MNIRSLSDIHMEFDCEGPLDDFELPVLEGESEMTLVLAGDVTAEMDSDCLATRYWSRHTDQIKAWAKRHRHVVMVCGNHEFYFGNMEAVREWWSNVDALVPNFHFLDNRTVILDGVRFIGGTMWTSMRNGDPMVAMRLTDETFGMNDFKNIHYRENERFTAADWIAENSLTVDYIKTRVAEHFDGPTVVVTHHAPSWMSIPEKFRENKLNDAYVCDLFNFIWMNNIRLWLHGHVHASSNYIIGDDVDWTQVVNNPRGYNQLVPNINPDFDPSLVISI